MTAMETRSDESELIARARKGELDAFNALVEHFQTPIYNLCLRMLRSPQAAEDATQEAFISAYRRLDSFRGGVFRSWLFRIASNACYDELRRRKARPALSLNEPAGSGDTQFDAPDRAPTPEDRAENAELRATLQQALDRLPADQRLALVLCDVQGMDYAEIAEVTRASLGTVKSRINRARTKMRALLLERGELLPSVKRPTGERT